MTTHGPVLELFYDIESPYSYLAFTALERYCAPSAQRWPLTLTLRPAFLGGVFKSVGNVPPASLAARAPYLARDLGRLSTYFGVELMIPEDFPGSTLLTMRFLTAVGDAQPAKLADVSRALYQHHWGKGKPVENADVLVERATAAGLKDAAALVARASDPAVKEKLKKTTDEAVERGAFGFPALFVQKDGADELFFGQDRLSLIAHELGLPWSGPNPR